MSALINFEHKTFLERYGSSLSRFKGLSAISMIFIVAIFLSYGIKDFWAIWIVLFPLPIYALLIKPVLESITYITKIRILKETKEITIEYLRFNTEKSIKSNSNNIQYLVFHQVKLGLANHLEIHIDNKKSLTQYTILAWNLETLQSMEKGFVAIGMKKPYGYNA